jgi:hypothetical protein
MAITGVNFVRATRHGLQLARKLWPVTGDRFEIRRQALKLRFWDERHLHRPGVLVDLTYESIKALSGLGVYELRVDDVIGGLSNIRIVCFDPPKDWQPVVSQARPMRMVWVLESMPKRRDDWTAHDLRRFRAARLLLQKRCYGR